MWWIVILLNGRTTGKMGAGSKPVQNKSTPRETFGLTRATPSRWQFRWIS